MTAMHATQSSAKPDASPRVLRITVALLLPIATLLAAIVERSGMSKTDVINRSIKLYDFIDRQTSDGSELLIRRANGEERLIEIL
jgi:hypothetical protein